MAMGASGIGSGAIQEVLLTISIDTECDHDPHWRRSNPLTFKSLTTGVPQILQPAFNEVDAVPTYMLTVEVLEDEASVNALKQLQGRHELGTHLHAAFIEPQKKYQSYAGVASPDFQCNSPPQVEYQKLENLTRLFEQKIGYAPTSFRAGRFGAGANTLSSLEKLGYKVDTSVTPFMRWEDAEGDVDFRSAPVQPYFPATGTICKTGSSYPERLLEVPVTMKKKPFRRTPAWFRPWFSSVSKMQEIFRYQLKQNNDKPVVTINMMFHSMEVIEKASPYPQNKAEVEQFVNDMHEVLNWCKEEGVTFCGLTDCYSKYRNLHAD